jgi:polyisoprenoid-binding protein YceI
MKEKAEAAAPAPPVEGLPAGEYKLDKTHASLIFRVSHLGFSFYTGKFATFDAKMTLDPANPAAATLEASVDPNSLVVDNPPPGFLDELKGPNFLDARANSLMTFKSTAIEKTGANTAKGTGDFTFRGVTKPVVFNVTFNGGYPGHQMDPNARVGFSGEGALKRGDFGMTYGIPAPGTTMGVADEVTFHLETEFTGPLLAAVQQPAPEPAKN